MKIDIRNIGLDLVVAASIISAVGVYVNNIWLDHYLAMLIWRWSNVIFALYFLGRWRDWWDGRVSDAVMMTFYLFCIVTNELGLTA